MYKNFFKALAISASILALASKPALASSDVNVIVNGNFINESLSEIKNERTYVPVRFVSEKLGGEVSYNHENKEIIITKDNKKITLYLDSQNAKINGKDYKLDDKIYLKEARTLVPLRFISEALGEKVEWNQKNKTAIIGQIKTESSGSFEKYLEPLFSTVTLPTEWKDEIEISYDYITEGDVIIKSKKLEEYYEKMKLSNSGTLFIVENSDTPLLKEDGLNLIYQPEIERFIYLSYPQETAFPEEIREEMVKLQKKYINVFKSLKMDENLSKKIEGAKILTGSNKNKKIVENVDKIKSLITPWYYFENTLAFILPVDENQAVLLVNHDKEGNVSSKVELEYKQNGQLLKYHLKFYEPATKLVTSHFSEEYAKREIEFFMINIMGYKQESLPILTLKADAFPSLYEKDKHECFIDTNGTVYVFDMTTGYLEYMQK